MKQLIHYLALALGLVLFATGCAGGPGYAEYRAQLKPLQPGYGRVWFYRPSAMGMAVQPSVKVDNNGIGIAVPHGFFQADMLPGLHTVSCTTEMTEQTQINVLPNAETFVRLEMMMGIVVGHVVPREVPEEKAVKQIKHLHLANGD